MLVALLILLNKDTFFRSRHSVFFICSSIIMSKFCHLFLHQILYVLFIGMPLLYLVIVDYQYLVLWAHLTLDNSSFLKAKMGKGGKIKHAFTNNRLSVLI